MSSQLFRARRRIRACEIEFKMLHMECKAQFSTPVLAEAPDLQLCPRRICKAVSEEAPGFQEGQGSPGVVRCRCGRDAFCCVGTTSPEFEFCNVLCNGEERRDRED